MASIQLAAFGLLVVFALAQPIESTDNAASDKGCFRAAVYEHLFIKDPADKPLQVLKNNFAVLERVVKRASFVDTKIIVLPEYSLVSPSLSRSQLLANGVTAISPDLGENLCAVYKAKLKNITQSNQSDIQKGEQMQLLDKETEPISEKVLVNRAILRKVSCLAAENHIYIAINLITLENVNSPKSPDLKVTTSGDGVSSELDTLKQSDQLINDKLTDQLNKIDKEQSLKNLNSKIEDYLLFNTELVFDDQGKLVAKYKKYNLFNEKQLNRTELQLTSFDTPYGRFGIAVCADLLFEQPIKDLAEKEKIDHLILSTAWFMDLPALAGLDLQAALAIKYKINVLSANQRNFSRGAFGSAIYNGKNGLRLQTTFDNQDRLLIADLPTGSLNNANDDSSLSSNEKVDVETVDEALDSVVSKVDVSEFKKGKCSHFEPMRIAEETYQQFSPAMARNTFFSDYRVSHVPLSLFQSKRLENTEGKLTEVCDKTVCCELEWKMNDKFNFASDNYYLAAISRLKQSTDSAVAWYEQSCSLVSYHLSKPEYKLVSSTHFDKLSLRGKFNTTTILPNVMSSVFYVVPSHKWSFKQVYNEAELSFTNLRRPITFVTLYGRVFEKDEVTKN